MTDKYTLADGVPLEINPVGAAVPDLLAIVDPDECPEGDMAKALNWFETKCRIRGVRSVNAGGVRSFLRDEYGRPDLADAFSPRYLIAGRQDT